MTIATVALPSMTEEDITCDICGEELSAEALAAGWPIATYRGLGCPSCYGDEAFCAEGHVLPAHSDTTECQRCEAGR